MISLPLFSLILFSYLNYHLSEFNHITILYFTLLALTQAATLSWVGLVLLPAVIWFLSFKKIPPLPIAAFSAIVMLFFLLVDAFIYSWIRGHFDWSLLQMILSPARTQIFNPSSFDYLFILFVLLAVIALQCALLKVKNLYLIKSGKLIKCTQLALLMLVLVSQVIYLWADAVYNPRLLIATELIPAFHGVTAKRFLIKHQWIKAEERPANVMIDRVAGLIYPLHQLNTVTQNKRYNIVLIAIDSMRADAIDPQVMPHTAAFMVQSEVFKNHFSGGNSTRAGIFSLFYGVNPNQFDAFYQTGKGPVLFEALKQQHYAIAAFTSASGVSPPFHRTVFVDLPDFQLTSPGSSTVERDTYVTSQLSQFIDNNQQKPFFAFVFYDSAHSYDYPKTGALFKPCDRVNHLHLGIRSKKDQVLLKNQYRNALHFIDEQIGIILTKLQKDGLLENTLVLITSDHGEEFDDNGLGIWGHNSNFTRAQTQVPLIVHWPKQQMTRVYHHTTSHFDIIPTLLSEVLGVTNPIADYSLGAVLSDTHQREMILMASYSNMALFSPKKQQLAVSNRFGYFQMQTMNGKPADSMRVNSDLLSMAYQQMHHFVKPAA